MEEPRELERLGWKMPCPTCGADIGYTLLTNQRGPTPFFYAGTGNHVLLRARDRLQVDELYAATQDGPPDLDVLHALWRDILATAPAAPDGGGYGLWTYVSCPHCATALVYDDGRRDLARRIHEPKVVLVDRAIVVGDRADTTWRVRIRPYER